MSTITLTATIQHAPKTQPSTDPTPGTKTKMTLQPTGQPAQTQVVETTGPPVVYQNVPPGPTTIIAQQLGADDATAFGPPWTWTEDLQADVTITVLTGISVVVTRV